MLTFVKYTDAPEPPSARTFFEQVIGETKSTSTASYSENFPAGTMSWSSSCISTSENRNIVAEETSSDASPIGGLTFAASTVSWQTRACISAALTSTGSNTNKTHSYAYSSSAAQTTYVRAFSRLSTAATLGTRFSLRTSTTTARGSTHSEVRTFVECSTTSSRDARPEVGSSSSSDSSVAGFGPYSRAWTSEWTDVYVGDSTDWTFTISGRWTGVTVNNCYTSSSRSSSWTTPIRYDGGTTTTTSQAFGTIVTSTLASTTMATVSGSASSSTDATYTRHTTATGYRTYTASATTTTKAWSAASNSPLSWSSRSFDVVVVLDTDRVLALRSNGWQPVPPGTYDRRELPLGLLGAEAQLLTTDGNEYSEKPATTGSYFDYTTVTITRIAAIDTTFDSATPGSVLPVESLSTITSSSATATVTFTTYGSNAAPTYTYSGNPSGDRRDSLGGFTSVSTSNATIWNSGGSTSWGSAYSGSSSASPLRWLNSSSYGYETQSASGETTDAASTNRTAKTYSVRGYYVSTGATGQDYSVTTTSRFSADLNSWWTYTYVEEGVSERNMLLAATPCEVGFVPYPGMAAGANLSITPAAHPPALGSSIYGSTVRGGALCPAFFGSAAIPTSSATYTSSYESTTSTTALETTTSVATTFEATLSSTIGAYSTTYLGSNSYRYAYGSPETTGVAEIQRVGSAASLVSVPSFADYAANMPPTIVGGNGQNTTVSLFLQRYSWYSFFAVAYSSLNLTDKEAAVTRGTWNCVPWIPESSATTMLVSSDAQVVFRVVPNVITNTSKAIGTTTAVPTQTALGWVTTATYDDWV